MLRRILPQHSFRCADRHAGKLYVTIINKERERGADVQIAAGKRSVHGSVLRLSGPSLESRTGTVLGGASLDASGNWCAKLREPVQSRMRVHAASAVVINLEL